MSPVEPLLCGVRSAALYLFVRDLVEVSRRCGALQRLSLWPPAGAPARRATGERLGIAAAGDQLVRRERRPVFAVAVCEGKRKELQAPLGRMAKSAEAATAQIAVMEQAILSMQQAISALQIQIQQARAPESIAENEEDEKLNQKDSEEMDPDLAKPEYRSQVV